jgi:hypothetical protein
VHDPAGLGVENTEQARDAAFVGRSGYRAAEEQLHARDR